MELLRLWTLLLCAAAILTASVVNAQMLNEGVDMREAEIGWDGQMYSGVISSKFMIHYVFPIEHLSK